MQGTLQRGAAFPGGYHLVHARMLAWRGRKQIGVVDAVGVEPAFRAVQLQTDPLDVVAGRKAFALGDHAQRHFVAIPGQHQVVCGAVGEPGLSRHDGRVVQRIHAGVFELDVQAPAAGRRDGRGQGQGQGKGKGKGGSTELGKHGRVAHVAAARAARLQGNRRA